MRFKKDLILWEKKYVEKIRILIIFYWKTNTVLTVNGNDRDTVHRRMRLVSALED